MVGGVGLVGDVGIVAMVTLGVCESREIARLERTKRAQCCSNTDENRTRLHLMDVGELVSIGYAAGLCAVGVCRAEPFTDTRQLLEQRKAEGLHATMQFTYRNPTRSTTPSQLVPGARSLIVGALDYSHSAVAVETPDVETPAEPGPESPGRHPAPPGPYAKVAAYARSDHYQALEHGLGAMAEALRAHGHRAAVSADENTLVDRAAAYRAGIGWQGKSANILVPGAGSMVVLGAVVTDAVLCDTDPPPVQDGCGSCRQCLDGCPTGAIIAPGVVDARRCLAWLVQADGVFDPRFRVALGNRIYGCDDCGDVCPPNRVRLRSRPPTHTADNRSATTSADGPADRAADLLADHSAAATDSAWVSLLEMLNATDSELMARFGRWYIPRREPRYLRRNALVVLANIGDPAQPDVRQAVERALADPDPLVAAHAVWCARRLGLPTRGLANPHHPLVAEELSREVATRTNLHERDRVTPAPAHPAGLR